MTSTAIRIQPASSARQRRFASPVTPRATLPASKAPISEHTHHAEGSAGSQCTACHMPRIEQTIKDNFVSAHTFRFISPVLTEQSGIPNPCTSCHTGQIESMGAQRTEGMVELLSVASQQLGVWRALLWQNRQQMRYATTGYNSRHLDVFQGGPRKKIHDRQRGER